jgi:hypothetical protein
MQLIERICAIFTALLGILTLSPFNENGIEKSSFQAPLQMTPGLLVTPQLKPHYGPIFRPPATPGSSSFHCDYSSMVGWESCSIPTNRKCWLRRRSDGKQYDIFTDYETDMPNGTTRYYELDINDSWYDADGMNFTLAKLFNDKYPGPWIEACWGDR